MLLTVHSSLVSIRNLRLSSLLTNMYFNTGYGSCDLLRAVLHIYLLSAQDYDKVLAVNMALTKCINVPLHTRHNNDNFCTLILLEHNLKCFQIFCL